MTIKAAAIDVYHTLGRLPQDRVQSFDVQKLLEGFGIPISYQFFEAAHQATLFLDTLKRPIHGWIDFLALLFARMEVTISTDLLESIATLYREKNNIVFYRDAQPALDAVKQLGLKTCAFTTLPRFMLGRFATPILAQLDHYFDASTVGFAKGDPRYYRRIEELLDVKPHEIAAIGDDELCDCLLPQQAGWRVWRLIRESPALPARRGESNFSTVSTLDEFVEEVRKIK